MFNFQLIRCEHFSTSVVYERWRFHGEAESNTEHRRSQGEDGNHKQGSFMRLPLSSAIISPGLYIFT